MAPGVSEADRSLNSRIRSSLCTVITKTGGFGLDVGAAEALYEVYMYAAEEVSIIINYDRCHYYCSAGGLSCCFLFLTFCRSFAPSAGCTAKVIISWKPASALPSTY